jgi:hypothetical protein
MLSLTVIILILLGYGLFVISIKKVCDSHKSEKVTPLNIPEPDCNPQGD